MNPYIILKDILFYSLIILFIIIMYRLLIKRLSKGRHRQELFCILYSLDINPSSGEIPFYFTTESAKHIEFSIENQEGKLVELANGPFDIGGHIIRFDSTTLPNGLYFYCLKTDNQETKKKFRITNS
jgi:hypothetical protein